MHLKHKTQKGLIKIHQPGLEYPGSMYESNDCGRIIDLEIWGWIGTAGSLRNVSFCGPGLQSQNWRTWSYLKLSTSGGNSGYPKDILVSEAALIFHIPFILSCTCFQQSLAISAWKPGSLVPFFLHFFFWTPNICDT